MFRLVRSRLQGCSRPSNLPINFSSSSTIMVHADNDARLTRWLLLIAYVLLWPPVLVIVLRKSHDPQILGWWSSRALLSVLIGVAVLMLSTLVVVWSLSAPGRTDWISRAVLAVRRCRLMPVAVVLPWLVCLSIAIYLARIDVPIGCPLLVAMLDLAVLLLVWQAALTWIGRDKRRRVESFKRFIAAGMGCVVSVSLIEAAGGIFQLTPNVDWNTNPKNLDVRFHTDDFDIQVITNSQGLREPRPLPRQHPGTFRIVAVGDSMTFGWGVEGDQAYPRVTERILRKQYGQEAVEVVNMGRPGSGPADYLRHINRIAENLSPDLIVVGFLVGNDCPITVPPRLDSDESVERALTDLQVTARAERFEQRLFQSYTVRLFHSGFVLPLRTARGTSPTGRPGPVFGEPNPLDPATLESEIIRLDDAAGARSRYERLRQIGWIQKGLNWEINPWLIQAVILRPTGPADSLAVRGDSVERMYFEWQLCERILLEMRGAAVRANAQFVVLAIPNAHLVSQRWVAFLAKLGCEVDDRMTSSRMINDWLAEFCRSNRIQCVDPLDDFRALSSAGSDLYLNTDDHMSPKGQRLLAEKLAAGLVPLLPGKVLPNTVGAD